VDACEQGDRRKIAEADFALHKTIIERSRHRRLEEQYRLVEQQIRIYIASSDALLASPEHIIEQHKPIVDAILEGKTDLAAERAAAHNLSEGAVLIEHLRNPATSQSDIQKKPS
jgi:DNA-binding GntR family transcriptional regulator